MGGLMEHGLVANCEAQTAEGPALGPRSPQQGSGRVTESAVSLWKRRQGGRGTDEVEITEHLTLGNHLKSAPGLGAPWAMGLGAEKGSGSLSDFSFKAWRPVLVSGVIIHSFNKHGVNFGPPGLPYTWKGREGMRCQDRLWPVKPGSGSTNEKRRCLW